MDIISCNCISGITNEYYDSVTYNWKHSTPYKYCKLCVAGPIRYWYEMRLPLKQKLNYRDFNHFFVNACDLAAKEIEAESV